MLMTFENYIRENYDLTKDFENSAAYPSVLELICLLPLSGKSSLLEMPFSLDDCII